MLKKIIIGRNASDLREFGEKGTVFIGKHIVGTGEEMHLTNPVHMDVVRPHIVLVCGKRGSGKSYTAGVIAEGMAKLPKDVKKNLCVIMVDTMGIYWSMKKPNEKDRELLEQWGLKPEGMGNMKFFIPKGYAQKYRDAGIDFDATFTLPCSEMSAQDWALTFGFSMIDDYGLAIERAVKYVSRRYSSYSIEDIISAVEEDNKTEKKVKDGLVARFMSAKGWGVFEKTGTPIRRFMEPGSVSVIDISHYLRSSAGWSVRSMVIGMFSRRIFQARLMARKEEEMGTITGAHKVSIPMVWMIIDEAHQFIPSHGITASSEPLLTLVKEGREPGISLVLITQMPNKLNQEALSQTDIVISHRLTTEADISSLRSIMQTYMKEDIETYINNLPRQKGSAIILDDNSERVFSVQIRPRISWHAGGSPQAIKKKGLFDDIV